MSDKIYTLRFPDGSSKTATTSDEMRSLIKQHVLGKIKERLEIQPITVTSAETRRSVDVTLALRDIRYSLDQDLTAFVKTDICKKNYKPQTLGHACNLLIKLILLEHQRLGNAHALAEDKREKLMQLEHAEYISQVGPQTTELTSYRLEQKGRDYIDGLAGIPGDKIPLDAETLKLILRYLYLDVTLAPREEHEISETVEIWKYVGLIQPNSDISFTNISFTPKGTEALTKNVEKCILQTVYPTPKNLTSAFSLDTIAEFGHAKLTEERDRVNRLILMLVPKSDYSILFSKSPEQAKYYRALLDI